MSETAKKSAARKAVDEVLDSMVVGLGSGSTAHIFIELLAEKVAEGLKIKAVATSESSERLAKSLGIEVLSPSDISGVDLDVDGADAIDEKMRLIKGAGGALLREKIVASASAKMVVIADEKKYQSRLFYPYLPVEILPFGASWTTSFLRRAGFEGSIRENFRTDSGNLIYDIILNDPIDDPEAVEDTLSRVPGLVETGLFLGLATKVILGRADGSVKVLS